MFCRNNHPRRVVTPCRRSFRQGCRHLTRRRWWSAVVTAVDPGRSAAATKARPLRQLGCRYTVRQCWRGPSWWIYDVELLGNVRCGYTTAGRRRAHIHGPSSTATTHRPTRGNDGVATYRLWIDQIWISSNAVWITTARRNTATYIGWSPGVYIWTVLCWSRRIIRRIHADVFEPDQGRSWLPFHSLHRSSS